MNEWTSAQTKVPCVLQDFVPFGAAAQKAKLEKEKKEMEGGFILQLFKSIPSRVSRD